MSQEQRLKATLATLEGITADFTVSHLESSDEQVKLMFKQLSSQTELVMNKLKQRIEDLEKEKNYWS